MSGKQNSFGFEIDVRVNADDPPMYVRDTSLSAYRELKDTGELGKQEQRIYQIILKSGEAMSLQEIASTTGIGINAVSGRVNGLKKNGFLIESQKRTCKITGRTVRPVRIL
jgi:biotin operon repressor